MITTLLPEVIIVHDKPETTRVVTLSALSRQLVKDGFLPGAPPTVSHADRTVDAAVCAEAMCGACGNAGLAYHPFRQVCGTAYRIAAVCPACGHAEEF